MFKTTKILILLALSLILGFKYQNQYEGKIIRVIDGDAFVFHTAEGSIRVRMSGIDAPEKNQDWGDESTSFLEGYMKIRATLISEGTDRYWRTLGTLFIESENINLLALRTGNAWHYKYYSDDIAFAEAEVKAREERIGLWQSNKAVSPWSYRKSHNSVYLNRGEVLICNSKSANTYHAKYCQGLKRCKAEVIRFNREDAVSKNLQSCGYCY